MAHRLRVSMISLTGFTVLSLALLSITSLQAQAGASKLASGKQRQPSPEEYVPVRTVVHRSRSSAATAEAVGYYEPFAVCEGCRCCLPSNASSCVETSCCYSIDCNLPGKPFGTCAFTPQTCGCGGTNNCTQPS